MSIDKQSFFLDPDRALRDLGKQSPRVHDLHGSLDSLDPILFVEQSINSGKGKENTKQSKNIWWDEGRELETAEFTSGLSFLSVVELPPY
jgi:hypothetical protein